MTEPGERLRSVFGGAAVTTFKWHHPSVAANPYLCNISIPYVLPE